MRRSATASITVGLALAGLATAALADPLEAMQGAWTMVGTQCADTFDTSGSEVKFKDRASSLDTGLIIRGKKIVGPMSNCTVERVHEDKGHFTARLGCADAVMFSEVSVSFAMIDDTHFNRIDPEFDDLTTEYQKCAP